MITTKKFQLTKKSFFQTLVMAHLKRRWWFFILIWALAFLFSLNGRNDPFEQFYVFFAAFYPIYFLYRYWNFARSKDSAVFLLERYFDIYEDRFVGVLSDETESTIKFEHFIKQVELKNIYLLYISRNQFVFIPKDAFKSEHDKNWFEQNIISKIRNNES
ncbi:MAG: YcxB family protein [Flavobacterium sp.]